jgi:hypothetical protein
MISVQRAQLGIDGNCGFALLGDDLQSGEAEFVEIAAPTYERAVSADEVAAARQAFENLKLRLNMPNLSFYFGPSHPYGG